MSNWIKQQATNIKAADRKRDEDITSAARDRELLEAGWKGAWSEAKAAMLADVDAFNVEFPNDPGRQVQIEAQTDTSLTLKRRDDRGFTGVIEFTAAQNGVTATRTVTPAGGNPQKQLPRTIPFIVLGERVAVRNATNSGTSGYSPAAFSQAMLLGLFGDK